MAEPPGHGANSFVGRQKKNKPSSPTRRGGGGGRSSNQQQARRQEPPSLVGESSTGGASDPSFFRPSVSPSPVVNNPPPPAAVRARAPAPAAVSPVGSTSKKKTKKEAVSSPAASPRKSPAPAASPPATGARQIYQVPYPHYQENNVEDDDDDDPPEQARPPRGEFGLGVMVSIRDMYGTPPAVTGRAPNYAYQAPEEEDFIESSFVSGPGHAEAADYQSFVSPTAHQDAFFTIADQTKEPTNIFPYQGTVKRVKVRNLDQNGTSFIEQQREVTFLSAGGDEEGETELEPGSNISFSSLESNRPMAFDNNRFFDVDDGYYHLLKQASDRMRELGDSGVFREPAKEMGFFGWLWRWIVRVLMYFTGSDTNRLMLTRGIQQNLFFLSAYESFVLGNLIRYFDVDYRTHDAENKRYAFNNRNVSRIVVRALGPRWNWIFHLNTRVRWSRLFDFISRFPFMARYFGFAATENFPATRDHALRGIVRPIFEGSWLTRTLTNQQGTITFDPFAPAQNLAAESTGFEAANRNQLGTFFGRKASNEFRFEHRLTTDESIIRTFITSPMTTFTNNGAEHVLRAMAKHWRNMLFQENGNFAHQRMEQLNPFEILRFHMPITLNLLANLRGRNVWDMQVLGPYLLRLQHLNPNKIQNRRGAGDEEEATGSAPEVLAPCQAAIQLIKEIKDNVVENVCGGIPSRVEPLQNWLGAISDAINELAREAEQVRELLSSVSLGIKMGYQLLKLVDWYVPAQTELAAAILDHINGNHSDTKHPDVPANAIVTAMEKLAPKDERTLIELIRSGHGSTKPAKLLLGRTCTLLVRELRRIVLDERIRYFSGGPPVTDPSDLQKNKWYNVTMGGSQSVRLFGGLYGAEQKWVDVETQNEKLLKTSSIQVSHYIPIAEAISRAQKAFMVIEMDYGKKFQYGAFMEFGSADKPESLRTRMRRLAVVSQIFCSELDRARLNVLHEVKTSIRRSKRSAKYAASRLVANCRPQNVTVFGGGPTGLMTAIHCIHNVLLTGGKVKVFESRDAFAKEGSAFERAQIVRLDSRQIAMLRYHLGTGFEDVYIPSVGETDAHLGNILPTQGFVEVTIKRLEEMILNEIIKLRSKGLLYFFANSAINYDPSKHIFTKEGGSLREGDRVFDPDSPTPKIMEVSDLLFPRQLAKADLQEGMDYDIVLPRETTARKYRLERADVNFDHFHFHPHEPGAPEVSAGYSRLPAVFAEGKGSSLPSEILFDVGGKQHKVAYDMVSKKQWELDFSNEHVVLAIGKPEKSPVHIYTTTKEPYAVCCVEGLKISMGMHNFGEKRFGSGLIDDVRAHTDANTRIIGDFTKSVDLRSIVERMATKFAKNREWQVHFQNLPALHNEKQPSLPLHVELLKELSNLAGLSFHRKRLQTRFFELGNNYYLGMEFPREYDFWKQQFCARMAPSRLSTATKEAQKQRESYGKAIGHYIDRLWYDSTFEILKNGDVYNPSGRAKIPDLHTIDSPFEVKLGDLTELDAFRLFTKSYRLESVKSNGFCMIKEFDRSVSFAIPSKTYVQTKTVSRSRDGVERVVKTKVELETVAVGTEFEPIDVFEILKKGSKASIVRTSRGHITEMGNNVPVGRSSDLSRGPDGYSESKVALASFPVAHAVSHRTLRVNTVRGKGGEDGFITTYVGDAQSSPHFMRYSGLTGACINCMSVNNLVGQAQSGVSVTDRVQRYAFETTWSNGEVVQRGTGSNDGVAGFLRPGSPYVKIVDYLYARAVEHHEIGANNNIVSRDWRFKFAASIVPRGLETDELFRNALIKELNAVLRNKLAAEAKAAVGTERLSSSLAVSSLERAIHEKMKDVTSRWNDDAVVQTGRGPGDVVVEQIGAFIETVVVAFRQIIDFAVEAASMNNRISSELVKQPHSVDRLVDDFATESQNFANSLTQSATFAATSVALDHLSRCRSADGRQADCDEPGAERPEGREASFIVSWLLAAWGILVAFGSMTNIARYKNRNEEMRKEVVKTKYPQILRAVFSLMSSDERSAVGFENDPYLNKHGVDGAVKRFLEDAKYYDQDLASIEKFKQAYSAFRDRHSNPSQTHVFTRMVVEQFIAADFHENSYVQESLVRVYQALYELLQMRGNRSSGQSFKGAAAVFQKLTAFEAALDKSVELKHIRFGFLRARPFTQTSLPVTIQYVMGPLLGPTVANRTRGILRDLEALDKASGSPRVLRRPIRDFKELHYATQESMIGSMMFLSAFLSFCFSVLFSVAALVTIILEGIDENLLESGAGKVIEDVKSAVDFSALGSMLGAILAFFHFFRKIGHLTVLHCRMRPFASQREIRQVRFVTKTQVFLTFMRLAAVSLAIVALPWGVGVAVFTIDALDKPGILGNDNLRLHSELSLLAVITAIAATLLFFLVEFMIRYNLNPQLGRFVCEPFRAHIEQLKAAYTRQHHEITVENDVELETEAWQYTAREFLHLYRFDTVFAADRFGTILQHLQSGNKKAN